MCWRKKKKNLISRENLCEEKYFLVSRDLSMTERFGSHFGKEIIFSWVNFTIFEHLKTIAAAIKWFHFTRTVRNLLAESLSGKYKIFCNHIFLTSQTGFTVSHIQYHQKIALLKTKSILFALFERQKNYKNANRAKCAIPNKERTVKWWTEGAAARK